VRLVVFGLGISSSWGNGHATLWRALAGALARAGHRLDFFEKDVPWYATHRDLTTLPRGRLHLYRDFAEALPAARAALRGADAAIVTSFCPDGAAAGELAAASPVRSRVFYDLDAPVTLGRRRRGEAVPWLGPTLLRGYDLVLSFTGGATLAALRDELGAARVSPLYGCVDPEVHRHTDAEPAFVGDVSYLGTWAASRQAALERVFLEPAARMADRIFVLGGSMYGDRFPWRENVRYVRHLPPALHAAFYCSSPLTVNVTRAEMAEAGFCPSARLFEAAACGVPVLSDDWEGLDTFFSPGEEILVARSAEEAVEAIGRSREDLAAIGQRARERALAAHAADVRAGELVSLLETAARSTPVPAAEAGGVS
jgi:spore maturation protein CgeB